LAIDEGNDGAILSSSRIEREEGTRPDDHQDPRSSPEPPHGEGRFDAPGHDSRYSVHYREGSGIFPRDVGYDVLREAEAEKRRLEALGHRDVLIVDNWT
jgi:hypothetical protein